MMKSYVTLYFYRSYQELCLDSEKCYSISNDLHSIGIKINGIIDITNTSIRLARSIDVLDILFPLV